jgi:hypothetical protein
MGRILADCTLVTVEFLTLRLGIEDGIPTPLSIFNSLGVHYRVPPTIHPPANQSEGFESLEVGKFHGLRVFGAPLCIGSPR